MEHPLLKSVCSWVDPATTEIYVWLEIDTLRTAEKGRGRVLFGLDEKVIRPVLQDFPEEKKR